MPELPHYWYGQLSYHKILPLEYNLSIEISYRIGQWAMSCLPLPKEKSGALRSHSPFSSSLHSRSLFTVCDNFREI